MPTYSQPNGTKLHKYFQDVEVAKSTVKDGTLKQRLDTHLYPQKGRTVVENRGLPTVVVTSTSLTPVHATSVTLTATITKVSKSQGFPGSVVFYDGVTVLGTSNPTRLGGVATLILAGGFTTGAHTITAKYNTTAVSAAITITAS